ncbi:MAG: efflux RND transporter permease subunit, partial [Syntrophorhabdaceae bacterium]|nr:efflux RND transporter permease subunit [Syntrophorhabdaceae bacterium]
FTVFILIGTALMFVKIPKGFLPGQDQNYFMSYLMAADRTSYDDMVKRTEVINKIVQQEQDMKDFVSVASLDTYGKGIVFVNLKKSHERKRTADEIVDDIRPRLNNVPGLIAYPQNPPPIQIGAGTSLAQYQCTLQGSDLDELYKFADKFETKMKAVPWITDVNTDVKLNSPKVYINVDRDKASALGLTMGQIQNAFFAAYGSKKVSTIYAPLNEYYVILEVQPEFKSDPNGLSYLYIQSKDGRLIPLNTVATLVETTGPISVNHTGQLTSATISFNLKPGYSIGQAVDVAKNIAREINLPQSITYMFQGSAEEFQKSLSSMGFLLVITIVVLYMILAILYESFIHPITILTALPLAGFGAILTLLLFGKELDMYGMVGIILLIGIVKKNGIMMVDFALEAEKTEGIESVESIHKACMIRFRPIMMTTLAALFGSLPIALGIGAGGDARQPMGLAVVGGLLFSQIMTLYVTPVFYVYFDRLNRWLKTRGR